MRIPGDTGRLTFRPFVGPDEDHLAEMFSDPEVMRFSVTGLRDRAETREWFRAMRDRYEGSELGFRAVLLRDTGDYAGHCGLLSQEVEGEQLTEVSYWLRRTFWGRGIATEAARAFRDFGFRELGVERLVSLIHPGNLPSQRVARRNGFELEREVTWKGMRTLMFSLTRAAWERRSGEEA